jgi:hypothetical protein
LDDKNSTVKRRFIVLGLVGSQNGLLGQLDSAAQVAFITTQQKERLEKAGVLHNVSPWPKHMQPPVAFNNDPVPPAFMGTLKLWIGGRMLPMPVLVAENIPHALFPEMWLEKQGGKDMNTDANNNLPFFTLAGGLFVQDSSQRSVDLYYEKTSLDARELFRQDLEDSQDYTLGAFPENGSVMEVLGAAPANRLPEDAELPPLEDDEDLPPLEEDVSAEEDEDLPPLEEDSDLEAPDLVDSDQERRAKAEAKAEEKRATAARMKGVAPVMVAFLGEQDCADSDDEPPEVREMPDPDDHGTASVSSAVPPTVPPKDKEEADGSDGPPPLVNEEDDGPPPLTDEEDEDPDLWRVFREYAEEIHCSGGRRDGSRGCHSSLVCDGNCEGVGEATQGEPDEVVSKRCSADHGGADSDGAGQVQSRPARLRAVSARDQETAGGRGKSEFLSTPTANDP